MTHWGPHPKPRCLTCGTTITAWQKQHTIRCAKATPAERAFYGKRRCWPTTKYDFAKLDLSLDTVGTDGAGCVQRVSPAQDTTTTGTENDT